MRVDAVKAATPPVSEHSILDRWARLVVEMIDADADPQTLGDWARHVHLGVGTLREVCRAAGVRGKRSLDLARVLRAVSMRQGYPWVPESVLNCRDLRTLRALLSRTGCPLRRDRLTLETFLAGQTVVAQDGSSLAALRQALGRKSGTTSGAFRVDISRLFG